MAKKKYLTTGKSRITGIGITSIDDAGVELELEEKDGERLVRLGACHPHGYVMAATPQAPKKLTMFDAIKKAVDNGKVTQNGSPEIPYLEGLLDRDITAKERDEAWKDYKATVSE